VSNKADRYESYLHLLVILFFVAVMYLGVVHVVSVYDKGYNEGVTNCKTKSYMACIDKPTIPQQIAAYEAEHGIAGSLDDSVLCSNSGCYRHNSRFSHEEVAL